MRRPGEDAKELQAREELRAFFEANSEKVFYQRQVAVIFEDRYFHWITDRALKALAAEGFLRLEQVDLPGTRSHVNIYSHKKFRFNRRAITELVRLVSEYSQEHVATSLGQHGELLIVAGFARQGFQLVDEETKSYNGKVWTSSNHDLDYIFEKDGIAYGVEVKNKLPYIDQNEYKIKTKMCLYLGLRPVFACRAIPGNYFQQLKRVGGFGLMYKQQVYPLHLKELTDRISSQLLLPVEAPRRISDGTIQRFVNYHQNNLANPVPLAPYKEDEEADEFIELREITELPEGFDLPFK